MSDGNDSESSYVYCTFTATGPTELSQREAEIVELRRKITALKSERDEYKRKAEFYFKMITLERNKKIEPVVRQQRPRPSETAASTTIPLVPPKKRWISMINKSTVF